MLISIACRITGKVVYAQLEQLHQISLLGIREIEGKHWFGASHLIVASVLEIPLEGRIVTSRNDVETYLRPQM